MIRTCKSVYPDDELLAVTKEMLHIHILLKFLTSMPSYASIIRFHRLKLFHFNLDCYTPLVKRSKCLFLISRLVLKDSMEVFGYGKHLSHLHLRWLEHRYSGPVA